MTNDPDGSGINLEPYDHLSAVLTPVNRAAERVSRLAYSKQFQPVDSRSPFCCDRSPHRRKEWPYTKGMKPAATATFSASMRLESASANLTPDIQRQLNELGGYEIEINVAKFELVFA